MGARNSEKGGKSVGDDQIGPSDNAAAADDDDANMTHRKIRSENDGEVAKTLDQKQAFSDASTKHNRYFQQSRCP